MTDLIISFVLILLAFFAGRVWEQCKAHPSEPMTETSSGNPQIVVNVPADYKPLQTLDGKVVVVEEKAVLWYSCFRAALDAQNTAICPSDIEACREAADAAVNKVYGRNPRP